MIQERPEILKKQEIIFQTNQNQDNLVTESLDIEPESDISGSWEEDIKNIINEVKNNSKCDFLSIINRKNMYRYIGFRNEISGEFYQNLDIYIQETFNKMSDTKDITQLLNIWNDFQRVIITLGSIFGFCGDEFNSPVVYAYRALRSIFSSNLKLMSDMFAKSIVSLLLDKKFESVQSIFDIYSHLVIYNNDFSISLVNHASEICANNPSAFFTLYRQLIQIMGPHMFDQMIYVFGEKIAQATLDHIQKIAKEGDECDHTILIPSILLTKITSNLESSYITIENIIVKGIRQIISGESVLDGLVSFQRNIFKSNYVGQYGRAFITQRIKMCLNESKVDVGSFLADKLDSLMYTKSFKSDNLDTIIYFISLLDDKLSFEQKYMHNIVSHALTQSRECLENDLKVVKHLVSKCGFGIRVKYFLEDVIRSKIVSENFVQYHQPDIPLEFTIISSYNITYNSRFGSLKPPTDIMKYQTGFSDFYNKSLSRCSLKWDLSLSRVELKEESNNTTIICDGVVALLLLEISNVKNTKELHDKLTISDDDINTILDVLRKKDINILLPDSLSINPDLKNTTINIDSVWSIPKINESTEVKQQYICFESLIDTAIISVLKGSDKISDYDLIEQVQSKVTFPIADDLYERRLNLLIRRKYIVKEGGCYKYLP